LTLMPAVGEAAIGTEPVEDVTGVGHGERDERADGAAALEPGRLRFERPGRRRWPSVVALTMAGALVVCWAFVAEPLTVRSSSMAPTLEDGDRIIVNKLAYRASEPGVGEVIVLESPDGSGLVVKRVVAVDGDEVGIEDGVLVVNAMPRVEEYVDQRTIDGVYFGPVEVPDGMVFVMGDNRAESVDSRDYGAVPVDDVVGRVSWRVWPLG
jgi:signal peptidase I